MEYVKPVISAKIFSVNSYLADELSANENQEIIDPSIDNTNLGDIGYVILNNIFNP